MLLSQATFGVLSSFFAVAGGFPYLTDIYKRRAHPHVLSWLGWAFITALGGFAVLADGFTWAVAVLFANTGLCLAITIFAIVRRVGVWATGKYDFVFFGIGVVGLILWQTFDAPTVALIAAIVADFCFGALTIIKTLKDPSSETPLVWASATISGLFSLFAASEFSFRETAYPLYLFVYDGIVLILTMGPFGYATHHVSEDDPMSPR